MYSRNFYSDEAKAPTPPENYSGVALSDESASAQTDEAEAVHAPCPPERCESTCEKGADRDPLFGFFGKDSAVFRLFNGGGIKSAVSGFGVEEILIIATAMFLFLSKEGDRECAVMLLLLLII